MNSSVVQLIYRQRTATICFSRDVILVHLRIWIKNADFVSVSWWTNDFFLDWSV